MGADDPAVFVGIVEYWHKRCLDKRSRGEWFELSAADIRDSSAEGSHLEGSLGVVLGLFYEGI